jgi:ribosomal protein S18 acetylase RimI-like enzyme
MASSKKRKISYKCPFCTKKYLRENLPRHLDDVHKEEIPEGFSPLRYTFHYINKRPLDYHGRCTECKGPTPWDEEVGRYKRQCGKQACHDSYVKKFEENMVKKTGHTRNTDTEEGLQNMLKNRKISGKYKFQNGKEKEYVGSYEKNCLEFMDKVMNIDPDDIMSPGPTLEYQYDGKTHYYITDFYYIPYNLIIEVKDGGKNPNNRNMPEYREKQIAKEKFIVNNTDYNYLRLTDNNLAQLLAVFADLKMQLVDESNDRVVHINEAGKSISYSKKLIDDKSIELVDKKYTKHLRVDKNTKGYFYFDKENFVGVINTEKKDNGEIWIQGLEVSEEYKKQGVGTYLLKEGERLGARYLSVNKKNTIAYNMYKKNGWKVFEETEAMYFMSKGVTIKESFIIENTVEYKVHDINDPEVLDLLKKDSYCKKYLDYISKNTGTLIVDIDNNKIIGYSFIGKNSDKGFIATIEVHKSYRRQGFGDILVDDAVKKHDAVDLLVLKSNKPAISLYKKHDFVVIDDSVKANGKPAYWMKHKSKLNKNDKVIPLDEATKINLKNIYFLSTRSDFDGKTLSPRVPDNYFTKNGYEDNTTKRICFCPTIDQCLTALSKNCTGMEAYVYQPDDISKYDLYRPTVNEVPDIKITGEVWITEPVKVKCVGKIHCTGDAGEDGIEYTYGDNKKAELYKWNWEWIEQLNEGYVINQKDILYNKDKFESGEINLCFVTGHSGSGKSTYTYKYAEDRNYKGVDVFSLDDLQWSYKYSDENLKEYGELAYKFFTGEGKRFRIPYRIEKNM